MRSRRLLAVTLALAAAAGCVYPQSSDRTLHRAAYYVDLAAVAGSIVIASLPCGDSDSCGTMKARVLVGGLAFGLGGLILNSMASSSDHHDAQADDHDAARAEDAARAGDCATAKTAMLSIYERDRAYFDAVVTSEPAIAACLR